MQNSQNEEKGDDLIRLNGGGVSTIWKFPANRKHCPVRNCSKIFSTRTAAIVHYKKVHAHKSILCNECKHPFIIRNFGEFTYHYKRKHPRKKVPFKKNTLLKVSKLNMYGHSELKLEIQIFDIIFRQRQRPFHLITKKLTMIISIINPMMIQMI